MAVRDELVEAPLATHANGSSTRKGTDLSSRAAHIALGRPRHNSRRSTPTSAAGPRRPGTGQGKMPRRARHTLAGRFAARHSLRTSHLPAKARLHVGCAPDTFS